MKFDEIGKNDLHFILDLKFNLFKLNYDLMNNNPSDELSYYKKLIYINKLLNIKSKATSKLGNRNFFKIASFNGVPIGYYEAKCRNKMSYLTEYGVKKEEQGKGYGKQLILNWMNESKKIGCVNCYSYVSTTNHPSEKVFKSLGFINNAHSFNIIFLNYSLNKPLSNTVKLKPRHLPYKSKFENLYLINKYSFDIIIHGNHIGTIIYSNRYTHFEISISLNDTASIKYVIQILQSINYMNTDKQVLIKLHLPYIDNIRDYLNSSYVTIMKIDQMVKWSLDL